MKLGMTCVRLAIALAAKFTIKFSDMLTKCTRRKVNGNSLATGDEIKNRMEKFDVNVDDCEAAAWRAARACGSETYAECVHTHTHKHAGRAKSFRGAMHISLSCTTYLPRTTIPQYGLSSLLLLRSSKPLPPPTSKFLQRNLINLTPDLPLHLLNLRLRIFGITFRKVQDQSPPEQMRIT